jgi:hypothetical protein
VDEVREGPLVAVLREPTKEVGIGPRLCVDGHRTQSEGQAVGDTSGHVEHLGAE